jgi:hypothetical protein
MVKESKLFSRIAQSLFLSILLTSIPINIVYPIETETSTRDLPWYENLWQNYKENPGYLIATIIGATAIAGCGGFAIYCFRKYKKKTKPPNETKPPP